MSSLAGAGRLTMGVVWTGFTADFCAVSAKDRGAPGREGSAAAVGVAALLVAAGELDGIACDNGRAEMVGSAVPSACSIVLTVDGCAVVAVAAASAVAPGTSRWLFDLRIHDLATSVSRMEPTNIAVYHTKREMRYRIRRVAPSEMRAGGSLGIDASVSTESI